RLPTFEVTNLRGYRPSRFKLKISLIVKTGVRPSPSQPPFNGGNLKISASSFRVFDEFFYLFGIIGFFEIIYIIFKSLQSFVSY
ncbi:MAG: hypothetical protein ACP5E3_08020, partial [Bacteroidales bacterium]